MSDYKYDPIFKVRTLMVHSPKLAIVYRTQRRLFVDNRADVATIIMVEDLSLTHV